MPTKLFLFLTLFASGVHAEADFTAWRKYSHAELISETSAVAAGHAATVALKVTLEPKWHTYWLNPGDSGTPLRLNFKNGPGVSVKRVEMPYPKRYETGPLITFGFEREVVVPIELAIANTLREGERARVEFSAEWLVCEDVCVPALDTFRIDLPVRRLEEITPSPAFDTFQRVRPRLPRVLTPVARYEDSEGHARLDLGPVLKTHDFVDYFPFKNGGVTNEAPTLSDAGEDLVLSLKRSAVPRAAEDRLGVLVLRRKNTGALEARQFGSSGWTFTESAPEKPAGQFWWMILSALIGGLILNLMPCVFPILSIKLLSLLKLSEAHPNEVRAQNLAYVAGVLVSFVAIALTLSLLRSAGTLVGWGFQLQSPVFLALLVWLFFVLALNLLGTFELEFFDAGVGGRLTKLGGVAGSFFTGVLAVVVASPCTAPFMGVALGFGLSQSTPVLIAIFLSLGLGLAFPYLVFAVVPRAISVLPRPGAWMIRVKQVMAIPLLLTDVWLAWILAQGRTSNVMWLVGLGLVTLAFAFWLAREEHRVLARQLAFAVLAVCLGVIALPKRSHPPGSAGPSAVREDAWRPFSPADLEARRGQNMMVNMTADWCLTCQVNERLVFADPEVEALLEKKRVVLIKGDWTQRNEDITLFLNRYDRVGVPFYVLFSARHPEGVPLPEILSKKSFIDAINREYP